MEQNKIDWKQVSHVAYSKCFITSYSGILNGKEVFKHVKVGKNYLGLPTKTYKPFYSLEMNSKSLTLKEISNLNN